MARSTLLKEISPPPIRRPSVAKDRSGTQDVPTRPSIDDSAAPSQVGPSLAAIEAGQAIINDHLRYFTQRLQPVLRLEQYTQPRMTMASYVDLYRRHQHAKGTHFVVHQHDHPIAGVHYDLRLQFSASSSISFAIPYGLPGSPNSVRPNRMAIETRVHNIWNNLIESASRTTGSLLIWDTGYYEILPYREEQRELVTDDDGSSTSDHDRPQATTSSDSERLHSSFRDNHIRLRLHGCRLPKNYTITLRLFKSSKYRSVPSAAPRKRRRIALRNKSDLQTSSSDTDGEFETSPSMKAEDDPTDAAMAVASDDDDEDATIRANNAYTGASNTIGSIHQRHWFLSLDKVNSGFSRASQDSGRGPWTGGWQPFCVMGRDVERSVITGRNADEVMRDEQVKAFTGRKMWRPITE